ncbi:hypothetical protein GQ53DRAFT_133893 [Thozetella sp. PMI_491]|nr:hypothetical protein GQ53DRAFT_133893 [Thozetella sp. PMI_491]
MAKKMTLWRRREASALPITNLARLLILYNIEDAHLGAPAKPGEVMKGRRVWLEWSPQAVSRKSRRWSRKAHSSTRLARASPLPPSRAKNRARSSQNGLQWMCCNMCESVVTSTGRLATSLASGTTREVRYARLDLVLSAAGKLLDCIPQQFAFDRLRPAAPMGSLA